jgi:hypothetical protein
MSMVLVLLALVLLAAVMTKSLSPLISNANYDTGH